MFSLRNSPQVLDLSLRYTNGPFSNSKQKISPLSLNLLNICYEGGIYFKKNYFKAKWTSIVAKHKMLFCFLTGLIYFFAVCVQMAVVMRCGTVMMLDRKNVCALVNGDDEIGKRWMLCWPNEGRLHEHVTIYNTSLLSS